MSAGVAPREYVPRNLDGLAVVEGLELGEFLGVAFDEVGKLVDEARTLETGDVLAPGGLERLAGCRDGTIDVLFGR